MGLTNSCFGAGAVRVCGRGKDVERCNGRARRALMRFLGMVMQWERHERRAAEKMIRDTIRWACRDRISC